MKKRFFPGTISLMTGSQDFPLTQAAELPPAAKIRYRLPLKAVGRPLTDSTRKTRGYLRRRRPQKNPAPGKITTFLVRMIATELNRTLSARQIAWFHHVRLSTVRTLADRLRAEGLKIPAAPIGKIPMFNKAWRAIDLFKRQNPGIMKTKGNVKAIIKVHDTMYYLNEKETNRLIQLIPQIAGNTTTQFQVKEQFGKILPQPE